MLFNSPEYILLFLPLVLLVYFGLNHFRLIIAGKIWLVLSSLFFYSYWNPIYLPLISLSIIVNFSLGLAIQNQRQRLTLGDPDHKQEVPKNILTVGVLFNLGLLGYFKYADFFLGSINWVTGRDLELLNITLPLAISFFTFQQTAYLVDAYKKGIKERDFLNYSLFVTFFPQLIAGPIVHHKEMMPQFKQLRAKVINLDNVSIGLVIFVIGLFKKLIIADTFAIWANAGFNSPDPLSLLDAWQAAIAFTFQLYFDFSGYSDMAIGAALLFNIRLPVNFRSPYKAVNIQDFWNRWHITLSNWLRDYLFIPLGGFKRSIPRVYMALFLTMLFGGLWHGAAWTFVVFGAMHGAALVLHRHWRRKKMKMSDRMGWLINILFINFTLVLFRSDSFDRAVSVYESMFGGHGLVWPGSAAALTLAGLLTQAPLNTAFQGLEILSPFSILHTIVFGFVAFKMPNALEITGYIPYKGTWRFRRNFGWALAIAAAAFLCLLTFLGDDRPQEFLYYQF